MKLILSYAMIHEHLYAFLGQFLGWVGNNFRETWGGADPSHLANVHPEFSVWQKSSTQTRWHWSVNCPVREPDKGTMAALPPAFTFALHNSDFPICFLHLSSCWSFVRAKSECLLVSYSVHGSFNGNVWVFRFLPAHPHVICYHTPKLPETGSKNWI